MIKSIENGYYTNKYFKVEYKKEENNSSFKLELKEFEKENFFKYNYITEDDINLFKEEYIPNGYSFGCYTNNNVLIGFLITLSSDWNRTLKIHEIHVHKDYQGIGLGSKMIKLLESKVIENKKYRGICIETQGILLSKL